MMFRFLLAMLAVQIVHGQEEGPVIIQPVRISVDDIQELYR